MSGLADDLEKGGLEYLGEFGSGEWGSGRIGWSMGLGRVGEVAE